MNTADLDIFFSDFASDVACTTWGKEISGIFDFEYVETADISGERPVLLVKTSDLATARNSGDLFTVNGDSYKLVDVQYAEPGLSRLVLADA